VSGADQFRQFAEEAMRWARQSKTEKEKQDLMDVARRWMQVATQSNTSAGATNGHPIRSMQTSRLFSQDRIGKL
jgi:hypothetical protein